MPAPSAPDDAAALLAVAAFIEQRVRTASDALAAEVGRELAARLHTAAEGSAYVLNSADRVTALVDGLAGEEAEAEQAHGLNAVASWLSFAARNVGDLEKLGAALALALAVGVRMEAPKAAATRALGEGGDVSRGAPDRSPGATSKAIGSVAQVRTDKRTGTAFCIGAGEWLTAEHVVSGESDARLFNSAMPDVAATVHGTWADADLALLATESEAAPLRLGDAPFQGAQVWALGYGIGQKGLDAAVKRGVVSERYRENDLTYIRTDAAVNPGDSGGPLLNDWGEVVGVHLSGYSGSVQGVAYALGADSVRSLLPGLRRQ